MLPQLLLCVDIWLDELPAGELLPVGLERVAGAVRGKEPPETGGVSSQLMINVYELL